MIRKTYNLIGKVLYWLTAPVLFLVSLKASPRVRAIVVNEKDEILLVRNWYGRQLWTLPGGGVKFREDPAEAARRELKEELGLDLPKESLKPLGSIEKYSKGTPFAATIFSTYLPSGATIYRHPLELIDYRWVEPRKLPKNSHQSVKRTLRLWQG
jgi:8-oxo-dGTP pyrophosphatase MutT (NUDIX family)